MNTIIKTLALGMVIPVALIATPVIAANQGQIEGGNIYRVKNVTDNTEFVDPVNADKCETLQYKVRIHNPGPGFLNNVNVKATMPAGASTTNTSTITVSSQNADPSSTSDNAVVNLSSAQSVKYVSGSTQLLDANGNVIQTLSDGVAAGGVNIGNVGVSINEKRFVQFQAKVDCPVTVTEKPQPQPEQPVTLPETGPAAGLAAAAGTGALGYAVHMYRRSRKALVDAVKNVK